MTSCLRRSNVPTAIPRRDTWHCTAVDAHLRNLRNALERSHLPYQEPVPGLLTIGLAPGARVRRLADELGPRSTCGGIATCDRSSSPRTGI